MADEILQPDEATAIFKNMGQCASAGSSLVQRLYAERGGQEPPFAYHGKVGSKTAVDYRNEWAEVDKACKDMPELAKKLANSTSSYGTAELLAYSGSCMSHIGKALTKTAGRHHMLAESSCTLP